MFLLMSYFRSDSISKKVQPPHGKVTNTFGEISIKIWFRFHMSAAKEQNKLENFLTFVDVPIRRIKCFILFQKSQFDTEYKNVNS